jgi:hypothetical protein
MKGSRPARGSRIRAPAAAARRAVDFPKVLFLAIGS